MTLKTGIIAAKLTLLAVVATCLSGCIIYSDHDHGYTEPSAPADEKPAETTSF